MASCAAMSRRPVFIIGAGGHAHVIASILATTAEFIAIGTEVAFLTAEEKVRASDVYIGIGDNATRERIYNELIAAGANLPSLVAPHAFVARGVSLGRGTVIMPGAIVMVGTRIGDNCIINTGSTVDHDCVIGSHTFIAPGVSIPGEVVIGERCFFGVKSATFPRVKVGDGAIVSGGSLVTKDVEPGIKVRGNPAIKVDGSG